MQTLNKYLEEYYPEILEEYHRYFSKENLPEIGVEVGALVSGYGGLGGERLKVVRHTDKYIELETLEEHYGNGIYLCDVKDWWREIKIIK